MTEEKEPDGYSVWFLFASMSIEIRKVLKLCAEYAWGSGIFRGKKRAGNHIPQ